MTNIITSFGIIVISKNKMVLIGKRISSLQYLDIFNVRCPISKIPQYVSMCTDQERQILKNDNFDDIYNDGFAGHRDYQEVFQRWTRIRPHVLGSMSKPRLQSSCMYFFPKGKRKINEPCEEAALREFEEETTIDKQLITKANYPAQHVYFTGSDDKSYKTTYFIYTCAKELIIEKKYFPSPFSFRQYRVSAEMEELLWVPAHKLRDYMDDYLVNIVLEYLDNLK